MCVCSARDSFNLSSTLRNAEQRFRFCFCSPNSLKLVVLASHTPFNSAFEFDSMQILLRFLKDLKRLIFFSLGSRSLQLTIELKIRKVNVIESCFRHFSDQQFCALGIFRLFVCLNWSSN